MCDRYEVHGLRFGVRSSSEAFAGWLRYALGAYLVEPTAEDEDEYPTYSVVVEDGARGQERIGRRYNILYIGTWDIARTLDLRFLARCLLRQIDSIGYHARDDALFLDAGVVEASGSPTVIHNYLVPSLCAARRRAENRGLYAPGGMVAALDLETGELIAPRLSLDLPADALERLDEVLPDGLNGAADRFADEDGGRRSIGAVLDVGVGQDASVRPRARPDIVLGLASRIRNIDVLGGRAIRSLAAMVSSARCSSVMWSSTNEMIDAISLAAAPDGPTPPVRRTP